MRRLILCADDFAFSAEVSTVIAGLAARGKLNATSCMAIMPGWGEDSALLHGLPGQVEIGLHLVLTGEVPLTDLAELTENGTLPGIDPLARRAARGDLPLAGIAREITAQFDRFSDALGRPPAFIDGHQHCHALPGIREIVLAETARRAPQAWVRDCVDSVFAMLARPFAGKAIGSAWHSRGLRDAAAAHGLRCNDSFAGHYGFAGDYAAIFPKFLRAPGERHLVMCHPGAGMERGDSIAAARIVEAAALSELPIIQLAAKHGLAFPA